MIPVESSISSSSLIFIEFFHFLLFEPPFLSNSVTPTCSPEQSILHFKSTRGRPFVNSTPVNLPQMIGISFGVYARPFTGLAAGFFIVTFNNGLPDSSEGIFPFFASILRCFSCKYFSRSLGVMNRTGCNAICIRKRFFSLSCSFARLFRSFMRSVSRDSFNLTF